jgi:type I restriction enzyme S subunit
VTQSAPTGWTTAKLGEIGDALIGLTYDPRSVRRSGTLVLRSSNVQEGVLVFDDNVYVDCAIPERIRVRDQDILICVRNGSRRLIGKSSMLDHRVVGETFGAFMAVFRSDANFYLRYFFQSEAFKRQFDEHLGATINQITNRSLNSFAVALPGEAERTAIAQRLNDADALVAALKHVIAKKQAIKQSLMQQLVTGRTRLPGFTDPWDEVKAGDLGVFKGGSGFPLQYQGATAGAFPFFKVSDMNNEGNELFMRRANNYVSEAQRKQIGAIVLPAGAIVFAKVGAAVFLERKRILTAPSCIDNNMAAFMVDKGRADARFIHYVLANFPMSSLVATGALPSLNGRQLRSISISLPVDLAEQRAIAGVLADTDAELDAFSTRLDKAEAIKTGVMQELLTGRTRLPALEAAA